METDYRNSEMIRDFLKYCSVFCEHYAIIWDNVDRDGRTLSGCRNDL